MAVAAAVALGVLTALGTGGFGYIQLGQALDELAARRQEIARLDAQLREREALESQLAALRALTQSAAGLQARRHQSVVLFNELAERTPAGVQLTGLRQTQHILTVQGVALSPAHVSKVLRAFAATPGFTAPELVEATAAGFTLRMGSKP